MADEKKERPKLGPQYKGRKKGSKNKRTREFEKQIERWLSYYSDPLEVLLAACSDEDLPMPTRITAAEKALPYIRSRKPVELKGTAPQLVSFVMNVGDDKAQMRDVTPNPGEIEDLT